MGTAQDGVKIIPTFKEWFETLVPLSVGERRMLPKVKHNHGKVAHAFNDMISHLTNGKRLTPVEWSVATSTVVETAALDKKQTAIVARRNLVDRKGQQYEVDATIATAQDRRQVDPERSYPAFTLPPFPAAALAPFLGYTPPRRCEDQRLIALPLGGLVQRPIKDPGEGRVPGTHRGRVTKWSLLQRQLPPRDKADRRMNIDQYEWLIDSPRRPYFLARLV